MSFDLIILFIIGVIAILVFGFIWSAFWLWWQSILSNAP